MAAESPSLLPPPTGPTPSGAIKNLCRVAVHAPMGRKLFVYECPDSITDLKPGDAVLAPFGRREILGWVIETGIEPDASSGLRLKEICEKISGAEVRPDEIALCKRLQSWYGTNFSDMISLFVPPAAPKLVRRVELSGELPPCVPLSPVAQTILDTVREEGGSADLRRIEAALNQYPPPVFKSALRELAAAGICRVRSVPARTRPARKKFVGPAEESASAPVLSEPQNTILAMVRKHPFRYGSAELARLARARPEDVRGMVRARLLMERTARWWRAPVERESAGGLDESVRPERSAVHPTPSQERALAEILPAISGGNPARFLLFGPTASGKTYVYEEAARAVLEKGGQVLLMVPEIALTRPLVARILKSVPFPVAVVHSRLKPAERRDEWERCASGEARLLVGPRSAAFVPLPELQLAIIDECHDAGYKDAQSPYLDARKVMEEKCAVRGAALVIGSATPTVEQLFAAENPAGYRRLDLTDFPTRRSRPQVLVIDPRRSFAGRPDPELARALLTPDLLTLIQDTLNRREACVLLLNRRGFAPVVACPECGHVERCGDCLLGMTYHLQDRRLLCHSCGKTASPPSACPACGHTPLGYMGVGTERLTDALRRRFPKAAIGRLDQDAFRKNRREAFATLDGLRTGKLDILIGTQMIAKGLDIPRVTLAAVALADVGLNLPDYRSSERTFQLLTQLIGRSGRHESPGRAAIQTFQPKSPAILRSLEEDTMGFYAEELEIRRNGKWPPFSRLAKILIQSENAPLALRITREIHQELSGCLDLEITAPLPAPRPKIAGEYRFQLLIRSGRESPFPEHLYQAVRSSGGNSKAKVHFEPDPISIL